MSNVTAVPIKPVGRGVIGWIVLGILAAVALAVALAYAAPTDPGADFLAKNARRPGVTTTASGLQYQVLSPGRDAKVRPTDSDVTLIMYEGKLTDGTTFDKSERPTPMEPTKVVPGFGEALKLMPKGARYRFWLKPSLGYGDKAVGPIPPNSVLVFDVELLDFLPEAVIRQMQAQQQMMQRGMGGAGGPPPGMPQ